MSRAEVVDSTYRLHPEDLHGESHTLTISAISFQGLEEIQPVAHFAETRKRLLLTQDHCRTLILLTGSSLAHDWVGYAIRLTLDPSSAEPAIVILPPPDRFSHPLARLRQRFARWWAARKTNLHQIAVRMRTPRTEPADTNQEDWSHTQPESIAQTPHNARPIRALLAELWRPVLVITMLSVVSFLYARAYGEPLRQMLQAILYGNGG